MSKTTIRLPVYYTLTEEQVKRLEEQTDRFNQRFNSNNTMEEYFDFVMRIGSSLDITYALNRAEGYLRAAPRRRKTNEI